MDWKTIMSVKEERPAGTGWQTAVEIAEEVGLSLDTVRDKLKKLAAAKAVEVVKGKFNKKWYRLKKVCKKT